MYMCWLKIQVNELRSIMGFDGDGGKGTEKEYDKGERYKNYFGFKSTSLNIFKIQTMYLSKIHN